MTARWQWPALVVLLGACKFAPNAGRPADGPPGGDDDDAPPPAEAGVDADPDAIDAPAQSAGCFGTFVTICLETLPTTLLQLPTTVIDTDDPADCDTTAIGTTVDACVRAGAGVAVDGNVQARGSRPLVLLAISGQLVVNGDGIVEVASHFQVRGAGSNPDGQCDASIEPGPSGGGPGGSLRGGGGSGGSGPQGSGGTPHGTVVVDTLRGGCQGIKGGSSAGQNGGNGGGAVALIAPEIFINGVVNASGAGGRGGAANAVTLIGGGGGGSGGVIIFDTGANGGLTFNGSARVIANGGGGGEGNTGAVAGDAGDDPRPAQPNMAAAGGSAVLGGDGGDGSTTDGGSPGGGGTATSAGGGGGGGAGFIKRTTANFTNGGMTSPAVTP